MRRHQFSIMPRRARATARNLIRKWHGKDRLRYAVTPRFVVTSSDKEAAAGVELLNSLPGALMQTHLSESVGEIETGEVALPECARLHRCL